jgi:hypothetical protein
VRFARCASQKGGLRDGSDGSQAEVTTLQDDFRFTPSKQTRAASPHIGLHGGSDAAGCHAVVDFVRKDEKNQNQIPSIGETQDSATFWRPEAGLLRLRR